MEQIAIKLAAPIRKFANGNEQVQVQAHDVASAIVSLTSQFPDMKARLLNEGGNVHNFVGIYVGSTNIRQLNGLETTLKGGDTLSVVVAVAGG